MRGSSVSRFLLDRSDWRAGPGLVPCLVLLALLACVPGARAARLDLGDAPDHRAAGSLLSPGVTSTFPTAASSGTELAGGIAIDVVDRNGNVSPMGLATVE